MSRFYSSPLKKIRPHIPNTKPHKKVKPDPNIDPLKELEKIMKDIKIGTLNGIVGALALVISFMIFSSSFNGSIFGSGLTFLCGLVFGICGLIFFKGDE